MMDTSEKQFERDIEAFLISPAGGYQQFVGERYTEASGWVWLHNRQHDVERCIYMDVLCEFIAKTQPKEWAKYQKYYGEHAPEKLYTRLNKVIQEEGLIYVLRNGIEDMGAHLRVCFFKPESDLNQLATERYHANILGCTRQFRYSTKHNNTIDMVLSVNGIPVVALELKNQFKGQDYRKAIAQFKYDRDCKEMPFQMNRRFLVYFAVDLYEAWMTTALKGEQTYFLPFNQGSNGPGVSGGSGNPAGQDGYPTKYLWEEVLQRDSLMELLHRFLSHTVVTEMVVDAKGKPRKVKKERIIFPRYHQYDVVKKVLADVRTKGAGANYLIQHSAGSGKSNSIAWLAYRLASLHNNQNEPLFNSVIVVTNRVVLDSQLQDTIRSFEHQTGLVEAIDETRRSRGLAEALNDRKRIIICTIQKFLFAKKDMEKFTGRRFAVIVDEAHQGQTGSSAQSLRQSLVDFDKVVKEYAEAEGMNPDDVDINDVYVQAILGQGQHANQSFFAFTATPKAKTIEVFGTPTGVGENGEVLRAPFHVYSMRQAISEGYILDVLSNYTTIQQAFKLVRVTKENPELVESVASRALIKYYRQHQRTIEKKVNVIMANFLENCRYQINNKGKAMVVADSRANAVRYYLAIKDYIQKHPQECAGTDVMVAFSGEVKLNESAEQVYTEAAMNVDANGNPITKDAAFRAAFRSSQYNILVVAEKYQTGFDEPLLHTMYVDKKLRDVAAVQTLSRLNRTMPEKKSTFILDFVNSEEEIKEAFLPYYEETTLEGDTDPNKLYDIRRQLAKYELYCQTDVDNYIAFMQKYANKAQDPAALGKLATLFQSVIDAFKQFEEEERNIIRELVGKFVKSYSYVTQLVRLHDHDLFEEYQYLANLWRLLPRDGTEKVNLNDKIRLEYISLKTTFEGAILLDKKPAPQKPDNGTNSHMKAKVYDVLQRIIDKVNERFAGNFTEADRAVVTGIYTMLMGSKDVKTFRQHARNNSTEMFVNSLFPDKFKDIVTQCFIENKAAYNKLFTDIEFYQKVQEVMARELYRELRRADEIDEIPLLAAEKE